MEGKVADFTAGPFHLRSSSPFSYCSGGSQPLLRCRTPERSAPNCLRSWLAESRPCGTLRQRLHADESAELSSNVCWGCCRPPLQGGGGYGRGHVSSSTRCSRRCEVGRRQELERCLSSAGFSCIMLARKT